MKHTNDVEEGQNVNTLSEIEEYYKAREQQLLKKLHQQGAASAAMPDGYPSCPERRITAAQLSSGCNKDRRTKSPNEAQNLTPCISARLRAAGGICCRWQSDFLRRNGRNGQ
jgi:hypothetical protein